MEKNLKKKPYVKVAQSCLTLCDPMDYTVHGILQVQNTGVGSLSLLRGIFPTQGLNPGLLHCRWILYQLSHKGSPPQRIHVCVYVCYTWITEPLCYTPETNTATESPTGARSCLNADRKHINPIHMTYG